MPRTALFFASDLRGAKEGVWTAIRPTLLHRPLELACGYGAKQATANNSSGAGRFAVRMSEAQGVVGIFRPVFNYITDRYVGLDFIAELHRSSTNCLCKGSSLMNKAPSVDHVLRIPHQYRCQSVGLPQFERLRWNPVYVPIFDCFIVHHSRACSSL